MIPPLFWVNPEASFCVSRKRVGICSRWAKTRLGLVGTIQPVQITTTAYRHTRGMHGTTSIEEGKAGYFTHSRSGLHQSAVVSVAGLQYFTFLWDSSFCLSRAQPKTSDPLSCCFSLYVRQALKKTSRTGVKILTYIFNEVFFKIICNFVVFCFLAFHMRRLEAGWWPDYLLEGMQSC